ncbi:MAG TPA: acyltransferase, partial [Puia sp.]|nr:acyltransferase [Puia sp.]
MVSPTPYLANLTPLRGIAALLVVFFHADLMLLNGQLFLLKYPNSHLVEKLYLMVDFFFVLSGFIMFHVYTKWFKENVQGSSFRQFAIARFARVYPLHFFTLVYVVIAWSIFIQSGIDGGAFLDSFNTWVSIPTNILLIQSMNLHDWFTWNSASWSISAEWWMYMLFPFLVRPFLKLNSIGRIAVFIACIGGYLLIMFYLQQFVKLPERLSFIKSPTPPTTIDVGYQFGFVRCVCGFVMGMVAYLLYKDGIGRNFFGKGWTIVILALVMLLCFHFGIWDAISVCLFPCIILCAAYGSAKINAVCTSKPMQRIGDWSFSIYLVHQPIIFTYGYILIYKNGKTEQNWIPSVSVFWSWIICILFIALTLVLSSFTYKYIEVPARKWINKRFAG